MIIWNMFLHLQHENAVMKEKYNELLTVVGEILETVKNDAKQRVENDDVKNKKLKIRCKFLNKGFCREGSSCNYSHLKKTVKNTVLLDPVNRSESVPLDTLTSVRQDQSTFCQ